MHLLFDAKLNRWLKFKKLIKIFLQNHGHRLIKKQKCYIFIQLELLPIQNENVLRNEKFRRVGTSRARSFLRAKAKKAADTLRGPVLARRLA